jgi:DNA-binding transcriptional LysR family regulator
MSITLEQARALDALARHGTFARAAAALRKQHTAVVYAMKTLEEQTSLELLDRRGYRTRLTPAGTRVLHECRRLLAAEKSFDATVEEIRGGWEPSLRIVFDGVVPAQPIVKETVRIGRTAPTRLHVSAEFLSGVEEAFVREHADLMISVLPPESVAVDARDLPRLEAWLVAHRSHPLARGRRTRGREELEAHVLVDVRGSDPRLALSTAGLEPRSVVHLNDFAAKKSAIVGGMGYGWMPLHLIANEVARGALVPVRWSGGASSCFFQPRLYTRANVRLGRAASQLVDALAQGAW